MGLMDIDWAAVAAAVTLWTVAVVSPGPAFAAITHKALSSGTSSAVWTVAGITLGSAIYGSVTLFGLVAIVSQIGAITDVVRWLGAIYLVWLGVSAWRESTSSPQVQKGGGEHIRNALCSGLAVELTNPKGIAFFVSVFAVSIPPNASLATKLATLVSGTLIEFAFYLALTLLLETARLRVALTRGRRILNRTFGVVFIGFGVALALGSPLSEASR